MGAFFIIKGTVIFILYLYSFLHAHNGAFISNFVSNDQLRLKFPCKLMSCIIFSVLDESLHKLVRKTHKFLQDSSWQGSSQLGGIFHAQTGSSSFLCHAGSVWLFVSEIWGSTDHPRRARDLPRCTWLCPILPHAEVSSGKEHYKSCCWTTRKATLQCGGSWLRYLPFPSALVVEQNLKKHGSVLYPLTSFSHTTWESHRVTTLGELEGNNVEKGSLPCKWGTSPHFTQSC